MLVGWGNPWVWYTGNWCWTVRTITVGELWSWVNQVPTRWNAVVIIEEWLDPWGSFFRIVRLLGSWRNCHVPNRMRIPTMEIKLGCESFVGMPMWMNVWIWWTKIQAADLLESKRTCWSLETGRCGHQLGEDRLVGSLPHNSQAFCREQQGVRWFMVDYQ